MVPAGAAGVAEEGEAVAKGAPGPWVGVLPPPAAGICIQE